MADLSNELDLNVPAAPSLTLDAAPAAPTLTLDPAADEKVIAESKKATPVQVEDTPLSPEEQKMVNDFAEKIDITNSQMVLRRCQPEEAERLLRDRALPRQDQGHGRDRRAHHEPDF